MKVDTMARPAGIAAGDALPARAATLLLPLAPLLIAVPVLVAIIRSVFDLVALNQPFFADISGISIDAHALFLGGPLYQDPNVGYTPLAYTPLFSLLIAALDHVRLWTGWPVMINLVAESALIALAARLAYRPAGPSRGDRALALAAAVGAGALAWWLVGFVPFNFLYAPRPDQLSWAFAFLGLALVPGATDGSRMKLAGSVLLLSAACWTKQTAAIAPLAALLGLLLAAVAGRVSWRTPAAFVAGMALLNGALFAALDAGTSGWASTFLITMPDRHARTQTLHDSVRQLGHSTVVAAVFLLVLALALALDRGLGDRVRLPAGRGWLWPGSWQARFALVLALFVLIDVPPSLYFIGASGAAHNVYVGIGWALALLAVAALGVCNRAPNTRAVAGVAVLALFLVSESAPIQRSLRNHHVLVPPKSQRVLAFEEYPGLRAYASHRSVYHPVFTDLNAARTGRVYQDYDNLEALLASGYQPGYLVRALLQRRFDLVYLLPDDRRHERNAGTGTWEDNYLWKLDQVMRAKYRPFTPVPGSLRPPRSIPAGVERFSSPGILERRPGPDPAAWMSRCFGPFRIAGVSWRIARGGGFWCRPTDVGDTLSLVSTRARLSEVRADAAPTLAGRSLRVTLPRVGTFAIARGRGDSRWRLRGRRSRAGLALELASGGRLVDLIVATPGPLTVAFASAGLFGPALTAGQNRRVTVSLVQDRPGPLSLWASRGSNATFGVGGLSA